MAKKEKKQKVTDPDKMSRRKQFVETYRMARKTDTALPWWLLGTFLVVGAVGFGIFFLLPGSGAFGLIISIIGGVLFGTLATMIIFGKRAQKAAYGQMEGQPGAAAAALRMLRRGWKTDVAIAFTKQQDVVHRVVGPPGIVLVGEGNGHRLKQLMVSERRKHERVASEVPLHEVVCGREPGPGPAAQDRAPHPEARSSGEARRDDRHPQPAQGARRPALGRPAPQGPGADQHEGHARQHARPLTHGGAAGQASPGAPSRAGPSP